MSVIAVDGLAFNSLDMLISGRLDRQGCAVLIIYGFGNTRKFGIKYYTLYLELVTEQRRDEQEIKDHVLLNVHVTSSMDV